VGERQSPQRAQTDPPENLLLGPQTQTYFGGFIHSFTLPLRGTLASWAPLLWAAGVCNGRVGGRVELRRPGKAAFHNRKNVFDFKASYRA
jgi:hypothetical protein